MHGNDDDEERKEITNPEHFQLQFDAIIASWSEAR